MINNILETIEIAEDKTKSKSKTMVSKKQNMTWNPGGHLHNIQKAGDNCEIKVTYLAMIYPPSYDRVDYAWHLLKGLQKQTPRIVLNQTHALVQVNPNPGKSEDVVT